GRPSPRMHLEAHKKQTFAYLRHLNTLSSGAIILQIGFLEKVFPHPKWKFLVAISLSSFVASIIASVISQTIILGRYSDEEWGGESRVGCTALYGVWLGFILGLVSIVIFAMRNLFTL